MHELTDLLDSADHDIQMATQLLAAAFIYRLRGEDDEAKRYQREARECFITAIASLSETICRWLREKSDNPEGGNHNQDR